VSPVTSTGGGRERARVAVLASGGGSNLGAMLSHFQRLGNRRSADVVLVASGRENTGALARARERGIAAAVLPAGDADAINAALTGHGVDLVVLAGYLSLVPDAITSRFAGRMLNVHPSLLPAFGGHGLYGLRVHRAVLDSGALVSGATVHFVDAHYDRGAIVAQWPVPVRDDDTPESLAARVLRIEHLLLPRAVDAVARGTITIGADGRVSGAGSAPDDAFTLSSLDDDSLAHEIDALFS
jgi:formyltetrahydrofolate-dependent phosphoribosylglycinamide formyltransferase